MAQTEEKTMKVAFVYGHPWIRKFDSWELGKQLEDSYAGAWQAVAETFAAEDFFGRCADRLHESQYWKDVEENEGDTKKLSHINLLQMVRRACYHGARVSLELAAHRAYSHCNILREVVDKVTPKSVPVRMGLGVLKVMRNNVVAARILLDFYKARQNKLNEKLKKDLTQGQGSAALLSLRVKLEQSESD